MASALSTALTIYPCQIRVHQSIKVLKEKTVKEEEPKNRKKTKITHIHTHTK